MLCFSANQQAQILHEVSLVDDFSPQFSLKNKKTNVISRDESTTNFKLDSELVLNQLIVDQMSLWYFSFGNSIYFAMWCVRENAEYVFDTDFVCSLVERFSVSYWTINKKSFTFCFSKSNTKHTRDTTAVARTPVRTYVVQYTNTIKISTRERRSKNNNANRTEEVYMCMRVRVCMRETAR